jgi:hypothetical protein
MLIEVRAQALGGATQTARDAWRDALCRELTRADSLETIANAYRDLDSTDEAARRDIEVAIETWTHTARGNGGTRKERT